MSAGATEKLPCSENLRISSWSYDVEGHAKKCVERYCELANRTTQQLYKVSTPCIDDIISEKKNWNLHENCHKYALKLLWNAKTWHELEDLIFYGQSTNLHDRSQNGLKRVTNDYLVWSLTFIIHEYKQYCYVGNTAKQCRLGLFQDSDFAGDLEDSKSTSGGTLCILGSHTFVPISWMCKKQTSVSHSSTESEIISLDAGLRLDGITALDLWDLIVAVLGNTSQGHKEQDDLLMNKREVRSTPHTIQKPISESDQWFGQCWFYPLKRPIFAARSFVVCVWRQRSSNQDDYKGKKSHNETCFQDPQSCAWLVVRSNQFGPQDPNRIHRHQKPTCRHANQGKFHTWRMESSFVFVQH